MQLSFLVILLCVILSLLFVPVKMEQETADKKEKKYFLAAILTPVALVVLTLVIGLFFGNL